jgi:hypothetical protein
VRRRCQVAPGRSGALLERLERVCGDDLARWELACRLAAATHGTIDDLEVAVQAVAT